jgi:hypothetical protein
MSNTAQDLAFVIYVGARRVLLKYIVERKRACNMKKEKSYKNVYISGFQYPFRINNIGKMAGVQNAGSSVIAECVKRSSK